MVKPLAQTPLSLLNATLLAKTGFAGLWKVSSPLLNCFLPNAFIKGFLVERGFA